MQPKRPVTSVLTLPALTPVRVPVLPRAPYISTQPAHGYVPPGECFHGNHRVEDRSVSIRRVCSSRASCPRRLRRRSLWLQPSGRRPRCLRYVSVRSLPRPFHLTALHPNVRLCSLLLLRFSAQVVLSSCPSRPSSPSLSRCSPVRTRPPLPDLT